MSVATVSNSGEPATTKAPCPICEAKKRCLVKGNRVICYGKADGALDERTDQQEATYYVHRYPDAPSETEHLPLPEPTSEIAPAADRDRVYRKLLGRLALSQTHRDALKARGISDPEINTRQYGTLPDDKPTIWKIVSGLHNELGNMVMQVPGFAVKTSKRSGRRYLTINAAPGLLVPVRNLEGQVVAVKVRVDKDDGNGKYKYLSSAKADGAKAETAVHVPFVAKSNHPVAAPCDVVRISEGELKADVATIVSCVSTLSVPSVGSWRLVLPVLQELLV